MALPMSGKTYRFNNIGAPGKRLNLYSAGTAGNEMNVVLYTADSTNEQQWTYSNNRLLIKTNTNFCLDRFIGSAAPNNADIYVADASWNNDQKITFVPDGNNVKIKLSSANLYLTAVNNTNGTGTGKSASSGGNVYWAAPSTSNLQKWSFTEVTSGGGIGNGTLTIGQRPSSLNYSGGCYTAFDAGQCTWHAHGRAKEVKGKTILFSATIGLHGKYWWNYVTNCKQTDTPTSNSIAVWDDGGLHGHVAYIEKVSGNTIYLTEANWPNANDALDAEDGKVRVLTISSIQNRGEFGQYKLVGYLVL